MDKISSRTILFSRAWYSHVYIYLYAHLAFMEKVGQVFHCVGTNACHVVVLARVLSAQRLNSVLDVIAHLDSYLHAEAHLVRKHFTEHDEQTTIAAADVGKFHLVLLIRHLVVFGPLHQFGRNRAISFVMYMQIN